MILGFYVLQQLNQFRKIDLVMDCFPQIKSGVAMTKWVEETRVVN